MTDRAHGAVTAFPNQKLLMPFLERVSDIAPQRVVWLSHGRLAVGKITILDGDPGLGKSTMMLDWAARITRGDPLPDGPKNPPRSVIVLSAEDGKHDTIRPRLEAAGADLSRVYLFWMVDEDGEQLLAGIPHDIGGLMNMIEAANAALVIIDPLMAFLAGDVKSHNDQDVRRALSPLATGLERTGAAGLISRHLNKAQGMAGLYRGGGSIGIVGAARFALLVGRDPDDDDGSDRRILAVQKCNIGKERASLVYRLDGVAGTDVARVVWEGESGVTARSLTDAVKPEHDRANVEDAKTWLLEQLGGGAVAVKDLQKMAGEDKVVWRTIEEAKRLLGIKAGKEGFGRSGHWVWRLPIPDGPDGQA